MMSSLSKYINFNIREKEEIQRLIGIFLNQTYLLSKKYDLHKEKLVTNNDYNIAINYLDFLKDYFEIAGIKLIDDNSNGVLYADSSNSKVYTLSKMECIYLILLKLIYDEKQQTVSIDKTVIVSLEEIHYKMEILKVLSKLPYPTQRIDALKTLRRFQLIEKIDGDYESNGRFIVYPSIVTVLNNKDILKIIDRLKIEEDDEVNL